MKILEFSVSGMPLLTGTITAALNSDLNIVTGRNGAGKTSILKLIWYTMSGNIRLALREVPFNEFNIKTDTYDCTVFKLNSLTCRIQLIIDGNTMHFEDVLNAEGDFVEENAEDQANAILLERGSSLFFPTFRRIEGGFGLPVQRRSVSTTRPSSNRPIRAGTEIEEGLTALARRLSNGNHTFISSISTADIVSILLTRYAELTNEYTDLQQSVSGDIIQNIKIFRSDGLGQTSDQAKTLLDKIRNQIEEMEARREQIMRPIEAVRELAQKLFRHQGISIGPRLSIGDAANAINSDFLSAGEKQMLSFICYNGLIQDSVVFIDEPELSLHVDWQRQLFPILLGQAATNQFIVATHSPFIYGKYPDKEICIDVLRGDEDVDA